MYIYIFTYKKCMDIELLNYKCKIVVELYIYCILLLFETEFMNL
jgi:hypothetical protein